jgi:outer membrane protein assembly factor BamB
MGGVIHCIAVETGEALWKQRGDGGGTWSSITQTADGLMYLLTKSGTTTVFRPDRKEFKQIALNKLDETTNASVVIDRNQVLIRTDDALWCFEGPAQE